MDDTCVNVNCSYCGAEMDCPQDMLAESEKHMCFACFQQQDLTKIDPAKVNIEIPNDKMDEVIPEVFVNSIMQEAFPEVWQGKKEELKELSKKEIAEMMFSEGAYIAICGLLRSFKKFKDEEK